MTVHMCGGSGGALGGKRPAQQAGAAVKDKAAPPELTPPSYATPPRPVAAGECYNMLSKTGAA